MDERYISDRDRKRLLDQCGSTNLEQFEAIYQDADSANRDWLDAWVTAIVARAHQLGATNFGPDAAKESIVAYLHWEDDRICEMKRQKALEKRYGYRTG